MTAAQKASILAAARPLAHQCALIDADRIAFLDEVRSSCAANACGRYGTRWICPPALGPIEAMRATCTAYRTALVFTTVHRIEDSFDFEGMMSAGDAHRAREQEVVARLGLDDCLVLGAGSCGECAACTYPHAPCRFPDRARPAVEAYGISVTDLAKASDIRYNNGENTVTYFSVVFFDRKAAAPERAPWI